MSTPCQLYVEGPSSEPPLLVANGLFEESIKLHHGKSIPIGLGVVSITKAILGDARLPLVEPSCQKVKLAIGMLLLWPRRLIVVEGRGECAPINPCPKFDRKQKTPHTPKPTNHLNKIPTKNSPSEILTQQPYLVHVDEMPPFVKILHDKLSKHKKLSTYIFPTTKDVFGVPKDIVVLWMDFQDLWRCALVTENLMSLHQV